MRLLRALFVASAAALAGAAEAPGALGAEPLAQQAAPAPPSAARAPEIVGNIRLDQPWNTGVARQVRASPSSAGILVVPPAAYAFPTLTSYPYGFAAQGGLQLNKDYLSPSDKLWLQAAYENGASGYIAGNTSRNADSLVSQGISLGSEFRPEPLSTDSNLWANYGCIFTVSGVCEQQWGKGAASADKPHWLPILSSAIYGSYLDVRPPANALAGAGEAVRVSNLKEAGGATNIVWPPLKGFDIGAEFMYVHLNEMRPAGLAPDPALTVNGLPAFQPNINVYEGRLRVQRAF